MDPSYRVALAAAMRHAVAAAEEAGEMLRRERWLPGGPRGAGSHAEADEEAERVIRARLLAATPWRWVGEETGRHTPEGAANAPIWIVDPNDGTAAYLRGHRGSTVSIGLVHRGVPVLGVVRSYCWPDDRGETIAWAEGCGAPTLDGVEITPATREVAIVAVSQDADLNPVDNARCVAPGRFLGLPSIAHRLARIGSGDVDAAVCLSGVASWDVAAGHALVRAVGGVVVEERGRELVYDENGDASATWCFGGTRALVDTLRTRPWEDVRRRGAVTGLVRPERGVGIEDAALLSRVQGGLVALAAADAAGDAIVFARRLVRDGATASEEGLDRKACDAVRRVVEDARAGRGDELRAVPRAVVQEVLSRRFSEVPRERWAVDVLELAEALLA